MTAAPDRLVVGGYELGARIGAGRIAHVYRAQGSEGALAIKLLAPDAELDDPAAVARFHHEVSALGAIDHANVVGLIDHGVDPELGPYLVMPLLEGRTLRALIGAGSVEPAVCALLARELAGGLAAIHRAGLVHRDLKPENIIIDHDGRPVILDLGLAWTESQTRHTEEGAIAGSVPYMAPEQIDGGDPSAATDLWALAVIAHEWITGARPFARPRQSEEVAAILAGHFEPLAERDRRVDPELGAIIDSCLGSDARPHSGEELHEQLLRLIPGDASAALRDPRAASAAAAQTASARLLSEARSLLARGQTFAAAALVERAAAHRPDDAEVMALAAEVGRAPQRPRRAYRKWLVVGVALAAVTTIAIVMMRGSHDRPAPAAPARAPALTAAEVPVAVAADSQGLANLEIPRHRALFADPMGETMNTMLTNADKITATGDPRAHESYARALMATTRRGEGIAFLDRSLERFPDDAKLWLLRGQAAMRTNDLDRAEAALARAVAADPELALAYRERGELRRLRGQLRAAFTDFTRARALAPDDAIVLGGLIAIYIAAGRGREARPLAVLATELAPRTAPPWIDLAAISADAEALGYLETALRNDPDSKPARRAVCLVGARVDDSRAHDDCMKAGTHYRHDPDIVLAKVAIWERRGNLVRARAEVLSGTYEIADEVRLWVVQAELEERLGYDYAAPKSRARACALGHQASCPGPAAKAGER